MEVADVSGTCGGASAQCAQASSCQANSNSETTSSGQGTCTLNAGTSASCSGGGGGGEPEPDACLLKNPLDGKCLIHEPVVDLNLKKALVEARQLSP